MRNPVTAWSVNPVKFAENRANMARVLPVSQLTRLTEYLASTQGEISVQMDGEVDDDRRKLVQCKLEGFVEMPCQTSHQPVEVEINRQVTFCIVYNEAMMGQLPEEYEPLLFEQVDVDLLELIEDELILSLPMAVHADNAPKTMVFGELPEAPVSNKRRNPFEQLASLKNDSDI